MSSAYANTAFFPNSYVSLSSRSSIYMLKIKGDRAEPYSTPLLMYT
jgi:hypothetical protein